MKLNVDYVPIGEMHEKNVQFGTEWNSWKFQFGKIIVSLICHKMNDVFLTHGDELGPFELAIIIDDCVQEPIGYLTEKEVNDYLKYLDELHKTEFVKLLEKEGR